MRKNKNINRTGVAITGAAVLLVGIAGNVHAIPISIAKNPGALTSTTHMARTSSSISLAALKQKPLAQAVVLLSGPSTAQDLSGSYDFSRARLPKFNRIKYTPIVQPASRVAPSATSVPDGGTTVLMLGGVFSGIVFLKRKLEARPGI